MFGLYPCFSGILLGLTQTLALGAIGKATSREEYESMYRVVLGPLIIGIGIFGVIMMGIVKELTAPKVRAIPRTLKYAAHPAMKRAAPPINSVNTFIQLSLCIKTIRKTRTCSHLGMLFTKHPFAFPFAQKHISV